MKDQFRNWPEHFRHSLEHCMLPPVAEPYALTQEERKIVTLSIQQFQEGENSEGKTMLAKATKWALRSGNVAYAPAMKLFIKEEQHHARMLSLWMAGQGIPEKKGQWSDKAFTFLRRLAGIEMTISVILTAELMAAGYYQVLRDATGSEGLKAVCERILKDEQIHIRFQSQALAAFSANRAGILNWVHTQFRKILLAGTMLVVWKGHRQVYQASGWTFRKTFRSAMDEFEQSLGMIKAYRKDTQSKKRAFIPQAFIYLTQFAFKRT